MKISATFSSKKSTVVLQSAHARKQAGVGELKYHMITLKTAQLWWGMKTLVWFYSKVRGRTQTLSEIVGKTTSAFRYLLFSVIMMGFCPQFH